MAVRVMSGPLVRRTGGGPARLAAGEGRESGSRFLRLGGLAAIAGQILLLVSSGLHPAGEHPANHPKVFAEYAADASWTTVHLIQWLGGVLMFVAIAFLARHLLNSSKRGATFARVALGASITVAAIFTVLQAVDGVALKMAVDAWAEAGPARRTAAFSAAEAIRWTEIGLNAIARVLQGVAIASTALAAAAAGFYGRVLATVGFLGGIGGVAGGLATAYTGFSTTVAIIAMPPWFLTIVWLIGTGIVMWRRAATTVEFHAPGQGT